MCTNPLVINRKLISGKTKQDIVPCGKCHECLSQKQSQFAALSLLQANESDSMYFCTLTYDNNHVPVGLKHPDEKLEILPVNTCSQVPFIEVGKPNRPISHNGYFITLSLRREDVKLALKAWREHFRKKGVDTSKCKYAIFGEYGEQTGRPHYHGLFYNFTPEMMAKFLEYWRYGFVDCKLIPVFNSDGTHARTAVSMYVSKYIGKDKYSHSFVRDGFVEKPRRLSSLGFGHEALPVEQYRSFILERI